MPDPENTVRAMVRLPDEARGRHRVCPLPRPNEDAGLCLCLCHAARGMAGTKRRRPRLARNSRGAVK